jgi:hypothetical protein
MCAFLFLFEDSLIAALGSPFPKIYIINSPVGVFNCWKPTDHKWFFNSYAFKALFKMCIAANEADTIRSIS